MTARQELLQRCKQLRVHGSFLHALSLSINATSAGPVIAGMAVPDVMYADDAALWAVNDAHQLQQLLDVLSLLYHSV